MRNYVRYVSVIATLVLLFVGCSDEDSMMGGNSSGSGDPPMITSVQWSQVPNCQGGVRSDVTITVTVTDSDTNPGELVFTGSVSGCTSTINASQVVVSCPQIALYNGSVTVKDPENNSDSMNFSFGVCENGQTP